MTTHVLYHGPQCCDGFASALAAWLKFGEGLRCSMCEWLSVAHDRYDAGDACPLCGEEVVDSVQYHPMGYDWDMPEIADGDTVYMLDYSRPPEELQALAKRCMRVVVLDHHDSAVRRMWTWEMSLGSHERRRFDMKMSLDKSGAVLAWEHFHYGEPLPALFAYVQDRDLWRWELPCSREVNARIASLPKDFSVWSAMSRWSQMDLRDDVAQEGCAILDAKERQLESLMAKVRAFEFRDGSIWDDVTVGLVNSPVLQSDLGDRILDEMPEVDVAAVWYEDADGRIKTSLRSRKGSWATVNTLAESYGGGGHPNAAGFRTDKRWWR